MWQSDLRRRLRLEPLREPRQHLRPHPRRVAVTDFGIKEAPEVIRRTQGLVNPAGPVLDDLDPIRGRAGVQVAGQCQERTRSDQGDDALGVEVPQQTVDEVVDAVRPAAGRGR